MTTILYSHPVCIEHSNGPFHPESPERLKAILAALDDPAFADLERREAPRGSATDIKRVHAPYYVDSLLEAVPKSGYVHLDPDTSICPASGEAALRAVGGVCAAVDAVIDGEARNAFVAVRPPGHHAERARAMGFCLFNNVAVAAEYARVKHHLRKVAIVDFDVHHGNGTQEFCEQNADLFYASSHQFPAYPGSGFESETGLGNIVNVSLAPGDGPDQFRDGWGKRIIPALEAFKPELLIISAGFDGHANDPLADLRLSNEDYSWITQELMGVADECCGGRVVSALEGGYDLASLAAATATHIRTLMST